MKKKACEIQKYEKIKIPSGEIKEVELSFASRKYKEYVLFPLSVIILFGIVIILICQFACNWTHRNEPEIKKTEVIQK